jgi:two-component system OmpR family sensor kinase
LNGGKNAFSVVDIVSLIAKEYDLKIDVISKIDVGTRIKIRWQD